MALDVVDELLRRVVKGGKWPPQCERAAWRSVLTWRAFAESDRDALRNIHGWPSDRDYRVDPLPERINDAWADHLFGEELEVEHPKDPDALELLLEPNDVTDDARAAERDLVVPEGEGWYRIYRDDELADVPLLEWHSRASVAPLYYGKVLKAAALITVLEGRGTGQHRAAGNAVFRHFEIHADGLVEHVLFRGTKDRIGSTVPLDAHDETAELAEALGVAGDVDRGAVWAHGLPMLMGRIVNKRGRNPRLGRSEYAGIRDFLLDLNEAASIGAENTRLTAKKRIVVPASSSALDTGPRIPDEDLVDNGEGQLVRRDGRRLFDAGEDVLVADAADNELGRDGAPFKVLEYSYDASALIAHKRDLVETALTRVGLTPVWVGIRTDSSDGYAVSGTSLRLRLIPTDKAGRGKARPWDSNLPRILSVMARLDALPEAAGGFGHPWTGAEDLPSVTRANPLPTDEVEEATVESTLVSAGLRSRKTSVKRQHPEWSDEEVDEELKLIDEDRQAAGPMV